MTSEEEFVGVRIDFDKVEKLANRIDMLIMNDQELSSEEGMVALIAVINKNVGRHEYHECWINLDNVIDLLNGFWKLDELNKLND